MYFSTMVDMAQTPKEIADDAPKTIGETPPKGPTYPWGLCVRLGTDELKKLGIEGELPEVGEMIHLAAMAKVTSVSQNDTTSSDGGKETSTCIELQITHLATENEDQENAAIEDAEEKTQARRSRFYGSDAA